MHDIPEIITNNCHSSTVIWTYRLTIWVDFQTRLWSRRFYGHLLRCVIRQEVLHGLEGGRFVMASQMPSPIPGELKHHI